MLLKSAKLFVAVVLLFVLLGGVAFAQSPGTAHSQWPHVIRSNQGNWQPAPGYVWVNPDSRTDLSVRWEPGLEYWYLGSIKWPHVIAASTEGQWGPAPGYAWVDRDRESDLSVRWEPGRSYWYLGKIKWPHVIASETEGSWLPESGYEWSHLDDAGHPVPGDLAVVSTSIRIALAARRNAMNEHWAKYLKEIQTDNAFPNWSSPPYDLYLKKQ